MAINMTRLLQLMSDKKASDLFITAGFPPSLKVSGKLMNVGKNVLSAGHSLDAVHGLMNAAQRDEFSSTHECNFAISPEGIGRFRVSAFFQRNLAGMVIRRIETHIPTIDELYLPAVIKDLAMTKRGLVIFVGATGAGKSTSLASMIEHRNAHASGHIVSIEDPVEYVHEHNRCIVTQREVGIDTASFEVALKNTLRQAPDVIMIGEVRSPDTMKYAISFAETGHLCLATLHANNADQALERIVHFFPVDQHPQIWMDLSLNLKAVIAQQLIKKADGSGYRAAVEVLQNSPLVSDTIRKGDVHLLKGLMSRSTESGMQTFDQALLRLYSEGVITYEDALAHADSANDLRLMIKLDADTAAEPSALESQLRITGED